jgi:hypothetical protein
MSEIIGYFLALVIGLLLGLLGGGGAILTIPVLVYLFHVSPFLATTYSLFIVGMSSGVGAIKNIKNQISFKYILLFGIPSTVAILVVRNFLIPIIPDMIISSAKFTLTKDQLIMSFFALLMIISGVIMLVRGKIAPKEGKPSAWWTFVIAGYLEGSITGIVGAGGGFIIVPILVFLGKLDIKKAISASLLIVALKSIISFFISKQLGEVNWMFLSIFTIIAIVGLFIGTFIGKKINTTKLKLIFGIFLIVMSLFIIVKEFFIH